MCGICGFTGRLATSEEILKKMQNKIIHRGPDSGGQYIDNGMSMGFRRLSIIDLEGGHQPIYNETGDMIITFNGEIYNHHALREDLIQKGHLFTTDADTEVLLHGYEEYGEALLQKLRGMFSFVIWDVKNQTLFGARDFFGIKPFYYTLIDGQMVYGSEIKSILEYPTIKKEVNREALENYLTFQYSVLPETFFKGIFKLMPAHCFTFKNGELNIKRYWEPIFEADENKSLDEFVEEIDAAMQDSIQKHKISDVEVGSFLSSGVDSSYVAASFHGDKTFTVGFDYEKYNEIDYAKELSEKIEIDNYSKVITTQEYWDILGKVQYHMDEPLADASAIALYFVSQTAAKHVKVSLSGEGADEFFGGYNIYREPHSLRHLTALPKSVRKSLGTFAKCLPQVKGKNFLIRGSKDLEERFVGNAFMLTQEERERILKTPTGNYPHTQLTKPFYDKVQHLDPVAKMQYIDIHFWLIGDILLKADKMSMAHSLEVRVPFLDRTVFDIACKLPTKYKVNQENTKYAMRRAAHRYLPDMVAEKKKLGFPVPIRIWLKENYYYHLVKEAFTSAAAAEFFKTEEIVKYLDDHRSGKADNSRKIWTIYMFLVWHKQFFEETNTLDFEFFLRQLKTGIHVDESCFYFSDDIDKAEHHIGFLPQPEQPYLADCCDIPDGIAFQTAEELVDAKIYQGKSLRERWDCVRFINIGGVSFDYWLNHYQNRIKYKYLGNGCRAAGSDGGWCSSPDFYYRCSECGYMMNLSSRTGDGCHCGKLIHDAGFGRFGSKLGDDAIEVYQKL